MGKEKVQIIIEAEDNASGKVGAVNSALGQMGTIAGGIVTAKAMDAIAGSLSAFATTGPQVESAFTGVAKTTDGLIDDMGGLTAKGQELKDGFVDMSKKIPLSIEEIMKIGELGGQLGIGEEGLLDFTRTVADMGVTTSLSTEDAAMGMARLASIMGTGSENIGAMGSVIVDLGNNFATTEPEILDFATRIAAAGKRAGMTVDEILAIAASFSSVGIQAEAGGTATQTVLNAMSTAMQTGSEDVATFAAVAGMSAEEFATLWKTDASAAFAAFVAGFSTDSSAALQGLDDLGIGNQRAITAFTSLGGASDILTDALGVGESAWGDNTALVEEAALRYGTTESQMDLFNNQIRTVALSVSDALIPKFLELLDKLNPLLETFGETENIETITTLFADLAALPLGAFMDHVIRSMEIFERITGPVIGILDKLGVGTKNASDEFSIWAIALDTVFKAIEILVGGPFVWIKTALEAIEDLVATINSLSMKAIIDDLERIGNLMPNLGGIGTIFSFQSGGMVPGPIGAPTMARVEGGEMILNPQQQSVINNYFNQTVNTRAEQSSVVQDFNMLRSLVGA